MPRNTGGPDGPTEDGFGPTRDGFGIVASGGGPGPWGNPGGGNSGNGQRPGGRPQGPWGGGPRGPGGGKPPDLDELIARLQNFIRSLVPTGFGGGGGGGGTPRGGGGGGGGGGGKFGGGRGAALIVLVLIAAWLASGFYNVQPDEQGVVLRFGAFNRTTLPGLNYHIPWPVESVLLPAVTRINRVEVGYRLPAPGQVNQTGAETPSEDLPEESLMLTGDENIIDINFAVFWRIRDAKAFLFNTRRPAATVKAASESVMREVIGRTPIEPALGPGRSEIEHAVMTGVQAIEDQYNAGVEITQVSLLKSNPPDEVIESFRDVQRANTDAERARNEAQSYANGIIPRARGDAARLVAEANGARQASVATATGQAQRFLSVLKAYQAAKDVTMQRLYIETMQDILADTPSVIVDDNLKGIVPFLPLNNPAGMPPHPPPAAAPAAPAVTQGTP